MSFRFVPLQSKSFLRPAFGWALLHAPILFFLFYGSMVLAVGQVPSMYRPWLWICGAVESAFLSGMLFLITAPFSRLRIFPWLAPTVMGLVTVFFAIDAQIHRSVGFHFNSFFLEIALQPGAFQETGIPYSEALTYLGIGVGWIVLEGVLGFYWISRKKGQGRFPWKYAIVILVLEVTDRLAVATFAFIAGDSIRQAGQVLPLQVPIRMNRIMGWITGNSSMPNLASLAEGAGLPEGNLSANEIKFTRKPDVLMILLESTRSSMFDPQTMPNIHRRSQQGVVFERHYSSASSTHYSLFSLFFGLPATEQEAVVGTGRTSLLFPALKHNGYQTKLIAASSVDWMDLTDSVFKDVQDDLITNLPGDGYQRDNVMLARARQFVEQSDPDQPLFLFLFFVGTHFRYSYPPSAEQFTPCWDGKSSTAAARAEPIQVERRARNAEWEADRKIEGFLQFFESHRKGKPLIMVTGDHGEEYLEHGRVGHATDVTEEQIHVPFVLLDEGLEGSRQTVPTGHIDVLPTLFSRLGVAQPPEKYCSGSVMMEAPPDRFLLATVGWEPKYALIGQDLKIRFYGQDIGFGGVQITDPFDQPLVDAEAKARLAGELPRVMKSLKKSQRKR